MAAPLHLDARVFPNHRHVAYVTQEGSLAR